MSFCTHLYPWSTKSGFLKFGSRHAAGEQPTNNEPRSKGNMFTDYLSDLLPDKEKKDKKSTSELVALKTFIALLYS